LGEIADSMLDGTLCAGCGVALVESADDVPCGFPAYCSRQCAEGCGAAWTGDDAPAPPKEFRCGLCRATFATKNDRQQHNYAKHNPHRLVFAKHRSVDRGTVPCGAAGCAQTFRTDHDAAQHRRMKHGQNR
jgi:hypothetical protein